MSPQTQPSHQRPSHQRPSHPQPSHQLPELIGRVRRVRTGPAVTQKWSGREISTGAAKAPRADRVIATENGLDGDAQGNLKVHGGPNKAMCCYPLEFMAQWAADGFDLPEGAFFENLTLEDLPDQVVYLGDIFELNDLTVQVTQPRRPCATVSARWSDRRLPRLMQSKSRSGYYLRVLHPGTIAEGDTMRLAKRLPSAVSVAETNRVMNIDRQDIEGIHRLLAAPELPERWRATLYRRLNGEFEDDTARLSKP
ncbi:MOSC domain-containing protein [Corynebacterium sp. ACRPX]|uniref:MOSC domain-containing protein n=1 Tax=unclassified Corynebacterium TaxID=2624378 RepID=UPI001EF5F2BC|nr:MULTISPECIES: MOSC domain-containing protein [unclassified Corynebacterium]MCG7246042.1 MOSC domain-containing protein [Corynebacterium sp. ACRPX]